ncbi:SCO family protein [Taibaiella sp. KBW10]|uniref:SCO family protein n=1 Tax=Taibaiella sp. KBW10 TaxID=2153357 RepID=UPI000F593B11|nr:SCO family protein [Taibaiella sp. KBW10]RQO32015.1 SCO family protein [Taibaiella sp. KBW10]
MSNKRKVTLFLITFFIALWAVFAFYYFRVSQDKKRPASLAFLGDETHAVRDFKFLNQDGDTITLASVKGKILVVEYFFTTCKGICPTMNENMAEVYNTFKNDDEVIILSHTVDPKRDTVGAMKEYAQRFNADSKKWMFLTGDKKALYDQARYSYLVTAADSSKTDIESDFIHTENFVLVDRNGRVRAHQTKDGSNVSPYDGTKKESVKQMMDDIRVLKAEQ